MSARMASHFMLVCPLFERHASQRGKKGRERGGGGEEVNNERCRCRCSPSRSVPFRCRSFSHLERRKKEKRGGRDGSGY